MKLAGKGKEVNDLLTEVLNDWFAKYTIPLPNGGVSAAAPESNTPQAEYWTRKAGESRLNNLPITVIRITQKGCGKKACSVPAHLPLASGRKSH
jgi:hypothetical protein